MAADPTTYLKATVAELKKPWPSNRVVNLVCHGHSVPAGYFKTPTVDTLHSYPHLWLAGVKARFPYAVANAIVTAIGGEDSERGAARFEAEVLCHRPDVITIDYGLNDRRLGLTRAKAAWEAMVGAATARGVKVLLLTPTMDDGDLVDLRRHADQIRSLADRLGVGLVDSLAAWDAALDGGKLRREELLSQSNHPNARGHALVTERLLEWLPH